MKLGYWVHSCCEECWNKMNPTQPVVVWPTEEPRGQCCFCGALHASGIVVRENPNMILCKGKTSEHEEKKNG